MEEDKNLENIIKPEDEENKTKNTLIIKIKEKIAKDEQRTKIRKENMNQFKKLEMSKI